MSRLEYRLFNEAAGFPVLYYYNHIDQDEVSLRFACDYFVKDRVVYEKTSCAIEHRAYVIYVQRCEEEQVINGQPRGISLWGGIKLEVREFREGTANYPIVTTLEFHDDDNVLLHLQADYLELGGREWAKTSCEVDEDRKVYVYYARPAG